MDRLDGQNVVAPSGEEATPVEGQADETAGLGVIDDIAHFGDVLPTSDRNDRKASYLRSGHEQVHRLLLVANTPPPRRRRRVITKSAATTTRTMTATISQPITLISPILTVWRCGRRRC